MVLTRTWEESEQLTKLDLPSVSFVNRFCSSVWSARVPPVCCRRRCQQRRSQHRFQRRWRSVPTPPAITRTRSITRSLHRTSPALWSPTPPLPPSLIPAFQLLRSPIPAFLPPLSSPADVENRNQEAPGGRAFEDSPAETSGYVSTQRPSSTVETTD